MRVWIKSKYRDRDGKRRKASYYRMLATVPIHGTKGQLYWAYDHPAAFVQKSHGADAVETETGMLVVEMNVHDASYHRAGIIRIDTDGVQGVIDWDGATHRSYDGNIHTVEVNGRTLEFLKP